MAEKTGAKTETVFFKRAASNKEDPNVFVCINGVNYLIPKGERTEVPDFVAEELRRSEEAEAAFLDYKDANSKAVS